jgi:hypothetical protein
VGATFETGGGGGLLPPLEVGATFETGGGGGLLPPLEPPHAETNEKQANSAKILVITDECSV